MSDQLPTLELKEIQSDFSDGRPVASPTVVDDLASGENNGEHQQHNISREEN